MNPKFQFKQSQINNKICSNDNLLSEILLPKVVIMRDTGQWFADISQSTNRCSKHHLTREMKFYIYIFLFNLFSFIPLPLALNLGNRCNIINVLTYFLTNCAMCFTYIHFLIYINAILYYISQSVPFCFYSVPCF